jgi:hypothetical protein
MSLASDNLPAPNEAARQSLTLRRPDEILAMEFDESDRILGDRLLAKGQSLTILGAGGIGKSRLLLQLAVAQIRECRFLDLETYGGNLRWMIIQGENSNRRLQFDLKNLQKWAGEAWPSVNELLTIHTLENDTDGFMSLDNPDNYLRISDLIQSNAPDVVCFDTLNCFAAGDLSKDSDMRETCMQISRLSREGNPERSIVVLHHALTGKAGASKATGLDRTSFGRNSKVLHAWSRGQINVIPSSENDNNSLVFSCGKCSNGKEFEPFAVHLNDQTMIYEVDRSFAMDQWKADVSSTKPASALVSLQSVKDCCLGTMTKAALVRSVMDETGCAKSLAYKKVDAAVNAKLLCFTKATRTYVAA